MAVAKKVLRENNYVKCSRVHVAMLSYFQLKSDLHQDDKGNYESGWLLNSSRTRNHKRQSQNLTHSDYQFT